MMQILKQIRVDWRDRRLIRDLYMNQEAFVRVNEELTEPEIIGRGVRQGSLMSPLLLFSLYVEEMMKEALIDLDEGVQVGGNWLKDVRFADDQGMVSSTEQRLQLILDKLNESAKQYDIEINVKSIKINNNK